MGKKKSKSTQTTTTQYGPGLTEMDKLRLEQERAMEPLRAEARGIMGSIFKPQTQLPGLRTPGAPGGDVNTIQPIGDMSSIYAGLPGFRDLTFVDPQEAFAASQAAGLTDVGVLERAAQKNFENIAMPKIIASLTAAGMGRGGAAGEVGAQAATQMALPIAQAAYTARGRLADFIAGLSGRRQALAAQTAQPSSPYITGPTSQQTKTKTTQSGGFFGDYIMPALGIGSSLLGFGQGLSGLFGGGGTTAGMSLMPITNPAVQGSYLFPYAGNYGPPVFTGGWSFGR